MSLEHYLCALEVNRNMSPWLTFNEHLLNLTKPKEDVWGVATLVNGLLGLRCAST